MTTDDSAGVRAEASEINRLITELWMASEEQGPQYAKFDLTGQQHAVLELIAANEPPTPGAIAERLGVTKAAISQHLAALESAGYISRERSASDGRVQILRLQRRGEAYRDALRDFEDFTISRYIAHLSASDIAEIVSALRKLKSAFTTR